MRKTIVFEGAAKGLNPLALEQFVQAAREAAGLGDDVSVLLTSNSNIRQLNSQFRGKNSATDVLSFPAAEAKGFAGDIAISLDIAALNARALGHSVSDEVRILILHGILHLAGYDHEKDRGEMERKETALRCRLGLPTGLIERTMSESLLVVGGTPLAKRRGSKNCSRRGTANGQRRLRT